MRGDRAHLRKFQRGVAKRTVVDRDLDSIRQLLLLGECPCSTDPCDHAPQLFVEVEAFEITLDDIRVTGGDAGEDLVQRIRSADLLYLLKHHRRQLAVALGKYRVGALGEGEE